MRICLSILIVSLPLVAVNAASTIDSKSLSDQSYQFTLTSDQELTTTEAQSQIVQPAIAACGDLVPEFGQYKFKSNVPLESTAQNKNTSFEFVQQVMCVEAQPPSAQTNQRVLSDEMRSKVTTYIETATEAHFQAMNAGQFQKAHANYSEYLQTILPFDEWSGKQQQLNDNAGKLMQGGVWRTTIYVDPPAAPDLGVYVAADFQYQYEDVPYRCGYLVWYSEYGAEYRIVRLEDGILEKSNLADLSAADKDALKAKFLCGAGQ